MTTTAFTTARFSPRRPAAAGLVGLVARWIERARGRRALAHLSTERLADIGLTEAEARAEASKPFWIA